MAAILDGGIEGRVCCIHFEASRRGRRGALLRRHPEGALEPGRYGQVRWRQMIYYIRTAQDDLVLLTLYAKSKTDNLTGAKLKEIRRALEE